MGWHLWLEIFLFRESDLNYCQLLKYPNRCKSLGPHMALILCSFTVYTLPLMKGIKKSCLWSITSVLYSSEPLASGYICWLEIFVILNSHMSNLEKTYAYHKHIDNHSLAVFQFEMAQLLHKTTWMIILRTLFTVLG